MYFTYYVTMLLVIYNVITLRDIYYISVFAGSLMTRFFFFFFFFFGVIFKDFPPPPGGRDGFSGPLPATLEVRRWRGSWKNACGVPVAPA